MPNQKIQVQVPAKFIMQTQKLNSIKTNENGKRLIVQNAQYPKQTVMLQTPNKSQVPNAIRFVLITNNKMYKIEYI